MKTKRIARHLLMTDWQVKRAFPRSALSTIEKAIKAAKGKVKLVKINIDEHPAVAGQMGIQSIPAVIAFNYFGRRIKVLMGGADECAHQVMSLIHAELNAKAEGKTLEEPKPEPVKAPVR